MVPTTTATARGRAVAPALGAAALAVLLAACGTRGPSVEVVDPTATSRGAPEGPVSGNEQGYTTVTPRAWVDEGSLEPDAPEAYTVVRGDTLWDISDRFLKEPWRWTEIWNYNPQIANPHLIYPGDRIALEYVGDKPTLVLTRNGRTLRPDTVPALGAASHAGADGAPLPDNGRVTRLSPRVRVESLDDAVPTIPGDAIRQFLVRPRVVDLATIERAPYVVGNRDGGLASAVGHQIYARGDVDRRQTRYGVFRPSETLIDPLSGEVLGQEITRVADAKLLSAGDPATLAIVSNEMETIAGDILLPTSDSEAAHVFVPRLPEIRGEVRVISLVDAISQSGRNQVIVLNVGEQAGIAPGDVLAIESRGGSIIDPRGRGGHERVTLPSVRTGVAMVFETFERVSYALVMESTRPVRVNDSLTGI